jgi:hypothetical protein
MKRKHVDMAGRSIYRKQVVIEGSTGAVTTNQTAPTTYMQCSDKWLPFSRNRTASISGIWLRHSTSATRKGSWSRGGAAKN